MPGALEKSGPLNPIEANPRSRVRSAPFANPAAMCVSPGIPVPQSPYTADLTVRPALERETPAPAHSCTWVRWSGAVRPRACPRGALQPHVLRTRS